MNPMVGDPRSVLDTAVRRKDKRSPRKYIKRMNLVDI